MQDHDTRTEPQSSRRIDALISTVIKITGTCLLGSKIWESGLDLKQGELEEQSFVKFAINLKQNAIRPILINHSGIDMVHTTIQLFQKELSWVEWYCSNPYSSATHCKWIEMSEYMLLIYVLYQTISQLAYLVLLPLSLQTLTNVSIHVYASVLQNIVITMDF